MHRNGASVANRNCGGHAGSVGADFVPFVVVSLVFALLESVGWRAGCVTVGVSKVE